MRDEKHRPAARPYIPRRLHFPLSACNCCFPAPFPLRKPAVRAFPGLPRDSSPASKDRGRGLGRQHSMQCISQLRHFQFPERQQHQQQQEEHRRPCEAAATVAPRGLPPPSSNRHPFPAAMSYSSVHSAESNDAGMGDGSNLQIETLHEWGSDLELASPRMFDTCILGSSWSSSISSVPFTALMSAPSPTSSSLVTTQKPSCSSWSSPSLGLNSLSSTFDYNNYESSSSQSNLGGHHHAHHHHHAQAHPHGRLGMYRELANPGVMGGGNVSSCHSESVIAAAAAAAGMSALVGHKQRGCVPQPQQPKRGVERTRSHCSDESVCTPPNGGSERQASVFSLHSLPPQATKLRLSGCGGNELSPQETSSQLSEPSLLSRKDGVTTRNMLEKVSGSSNHHHHRGPTERMTEITLGELSNYFNMPITQASKELKVGLTVLKKRCREFGIPRWPHRKMKSLDSLIHNIQELAKGPEGKTSAPVMNAVKELEHQKKRMEERPGIELAERTKRLRQACFKASYKKRRQAQTLAQQESYGVSGAVPVDQCVSTLVS